MSGVQITLTGGSPWGLTMVGGKDFHQPLSVGKVKPHGKASQSGIAEGYMIEKVNGIHVGNLTHHEAQNVIKNAGFTLTLTLRKPNPREAPPATTSQSKTSPAPVQYKASATYGQSDHDAGALRNGANLNQSPALYTKTQAPAKASSVGGKRPSMTITSDIKEMIAEEESESTSPPPGGMRTGGVKKWPPQALTGSNHTASSCSREEKGKAASNIDNFFQGSSAPTHGEPTFTKSLQDITGPLGEPAVLEVRLGRNLPAPTVHWYHNNKPLRESREKDIRFLSNGPIHTVVLGELTQELTGTFTCTIMNKNGSKSTRCRISIDKTKPQIEDHASYAPPRSPLSPTNESKRVIASTSLGLYSNQNVQETYDGQINRKASRDGGEESEVMKALREGAQKQNSKTPSMKFLEQSLLAESDDL